MRKISEDARTDRGWALARLGDDGWWPAVERGLRHGTFEDDVIAGLAERDPWRVLGTSRRLSLREPPRAIIRQAATSNSSERAFQRCASFVARLTDVGAGY